jgi:hypothetical protein
VRALAIESNEQARRLEARWDWSRADALPVLPLRILNNLSRLPNIHPLNSVFSLRLLRAYTAIKYKTVQRRLLVEMIAASQR